MGMTSAVLEEGILPGGRAFERGTWTEGASGTTGNVTCNTSALPEIVKIDFASAASDGDDAGLTWALDSGATVLKLTYTAGDTGTYYIEGKAG